MRGGWRVFSPLRAAKIFFVGPRGAPAGANSPPGGVAAFFWLEFFSGRGRWRGVGLGCRCVFVAGFWVGGGGGLVLVVSVMEISDSMIGKKIRRCEIFFVWRDKEKKRAAKIFFRGRQKVADLHFT